MNASECDKHKDLKDVETFFSHPWPTWFRYRCLSLCRWIAIRTGATAAKMSKKLDASTAYVSECDEHDFQPFVIHPWLKRFRCRRWCTDRIAQVRKRLRQGWICNDFMIWTICGSIDNKRIGDVDWPSKSTAAKDCIHNRFNAHLEEFSF